MQKEAQADPLQVGTASSEGRQVEKETFLFEPQPLFDCVFCLSKRKNLLYNLSQKNLISNHQDHFIEQINYEPILVSENALALARSSNPDAAACLAPKSFTT